MKQIGNGRKGLGLLLALMIGLMCAAAGAEAPAAAGTIRSLYDAAVTLLTATDNVTIRGEASFLLDGTSFKEAKATIIHQGGNAYQQLAFTAPGEDGKIIENGYTVIGFGEAVFANETYHGKDHVKMFFRQPTDSILQSGTPLLSVLLRLGESVADQLDRELVGKGAVGDDGAIELRLTAEDLKGLPSTAAELLWRYLTGRYFGFNWMNWMDYSTGEYGDVEDYGTPTAGIIATTRTLQVDRLDLTLRQDGEGRLTGTEGEAVLTLSGALQGHTLNIRFSATAEDYGSSLVPDPRKEDWTAEKLAEAYLYTDLKPLDTDSGEDGDSETSGQSGMVPEVPEFTSGLNVREIGSDEDAVAYAKEIWNMDYFGAGDLSGYEWRASQTDDGRYVVYGSDPKDTPDHFLQTEFGRDGAVTLIRNAASDMDLAGPRGDERYEAGEFDDVRAQISSRMLMLAGILEPGATAEYLASQEYNEGHGNWYAAYEGVAFRKNSDFMTFYTEKNWETGYRTKFIVQITPEIRVVYFNSHTDAMEGGNG